MDEVEANFLMHARNGNAQDIKDILSAQTDLDVNCKGRLKSNRGWTALHLASYFGHNDVVTSLLIYGADPNVKNCSGDTPLHKAAFTSRENVLHKLLEYNADVFMRNDERNKPSNVACNPMIKSILQAAERVQSEKIIERVFTAAKEENVETMDKTLTSHPDIVSANTQDDLGNTPLHYAALRDNQAVAVYLLHHGGDSSIANKEGSTAIDICKTVQLRRLLDVQPIQNTIRNVQRFEGFIYRKRFMRPRLHWVVLDRGVLSYFARHADAVTGAKRRMFKYLTDAVVTVKEENNNTFQIEFFDDSVHHLQVKKDPEAHISRQKWINAIQLHIDYSSHYAKVGRLQESDSDEEDILPLVDIQNTVETGIAHNQLLKKKIDEFNVAVHKMALSENSQSVQMLLGKCHQILSISNEVATALSSCLTTLQRQDEVRKVQLTQEKEKTRVWQQAFEALAAEHHQLERTISFQTPESLAVMASTSQTPEVFNSEDINVFGRANSPTESSGSTFFSDEDQFYDAFESEEEDELGTSPRQGTECAAKANSENYAKTQLNENLNNISRTSNEPATSNNLSELETSEKHEKQIKKTHYKHEHREVHIKSGRMHSQIVDDSECIEETVKTSHGTKISHMEKKQHIEKQSSLAETAATVSDSRSFQDCNDFMYRQKLPVVMFSREDFSMWSILKQCIGKELSKITMPVIFNEPLSFLQRLCEYMEYTHLLKEACDLQDSTLRLQYVAAFAVSALASQLGRVGKPYNPLLGETFEFNRPDLGFLWISEQVSHHPPISAFHATGTDASFDFHGSVHPKLKFWGKSVEVEPKGNMTLTLRKFGETYTWSNPHCSVHNVVVGKPWIEQHGVVEITNHSTKEKCVLNFKAHSWFRNDLNKVEGYIINSKRKKLLYLEGDWTKHLYSLTPKSYETFRQELNPQNKSSRKASSSSKSSMNDILQSQAVSDDGCVKIWEVESRPTFSKDYYSFTRFAMTLNEFADKDEGNLPPTDTRCRPDVRCQENGDIDGAGDEKWRLEEKQRAARKSRTKLKEEWKPRWFKNDTNPTTNAQDWLFLKEYKDGDWSNCPDIF